MLMEQSFFLTELVMASRIIPDTGLPVFSSGSFSRSYSSFSSSTRKRTVLPVSFREVLLG